MDKSQADLQRRALDEPRVTLDELARIMGRSRASADGYREGRSMMPREVRLRLASFLCAKARALQHLAQELANGLD